MATNLKNVIYPVKDIASAKEFYKKLLGVDPYADSPYYVGFKNGEMEIGLTPSGHEATTPYFEVDDIKGMIKTMTESGAQLIQDARDVGVGRLVAMLKDKDGNFFGLQQDTK